MLVDRLALSATERAFLQQVEFRLGVTQKEIQESEIDASLQPGVLLAVPPGEAKERDFVSLCQEDSGSPLEDVAAGPKKSGKKRPPRVFECFVPYDASRFATVEQALAKLDVEKCKFYEGRLESILFEECGKSEGSLSDKRGPSVILDGVVAGDESVEDDGVPAGSHLKSLVSRFNRRTGYGITGRATCPATEGSLRGYPGPPPRISAPPTRTALSLKARATGLVPVAEDEDEAKGRHTEAVIIDGVDLRDDPEANNAASRIQRRFRNKKHAAVPVIQAETKKAEENPVKTLGLTGSAEETKAATSIQLRFRKKQALRKAQEQTSSTENSRPSGDTSTSTGSEDKAKSGTTGSEAADKKSPTSSSNSSSLLSIDSSSSSSSSSAASSPAELSESSGVQGNKSGDGSSVSASPISAESGTGEDTTLLADLQNFMTSPKEAFSWGGIDVGSLHTNVTTMTTTTTTTTKTNRVSGRGSANGGPRIALLACKVVIKQPFVTSEKKYLELGISGVPEDYDAIVFEEESTTSSEFNIAGGASTEQVTTSTTTTSCTTASHQITASASQTVSSSSMMSASTIKSPGNGAIYRVRSLRQVLPLYAIELESVSKREEISHMKCHNCRERGVTTDSQWSVELEGWTLCNDCLESFEKFIPDYKTKKKVVPIGDMQPVAKKCPTHPGENLDLWCDECARPICQLCKVIGDHSTGEFRGHHITGLTAKHTQVQMDIRRSKTHFKFAKYQLQRSIDTCSARIAGVEENIETMLKMVRDQHKEIEIQIAKAAREGRSALQSKRGILDAFSSQMDYAERYMNYIANPDVLDAGEFIEIADQFPVQMRRLAAGLNDNAEYEFDEGESFIPNMQIEGEVGIIERCKPKYVFKKAQKNVLAAQKITGFLKREVGKKQSPMTPAIPTLVTPRAPSTAQVSPADMVEEKQEEESLVEPLEAPQLEASAPRSLAPTPQVLTNPLSALGRAPAEKETSSNPLAGAARTNLMPYDIIDYELVDHDSQQIAASPLDSGAAQGKDVSTKPSYNRTAGVKRMFAGSQQLTNLENIIRRDPDRIPISQQYRKLSNLPPPPESCASTRKFTNLLRKSSRGMNDDTLAEAPTEYESDFESSSSSIMDPSESVSQVGPVFQSRRAGARNLFGGKSEALDMMAPGENTKPAPVAPAAENVTVPPTPAAPTEFTLVVDSGGQKRKYRLNIVPKNQGGFAPAARAAPVGAQHHDVVARKMSAIAQSGCGGSLREAIGEVSVEAQNQQSASEQGDGSINYGVRVSTAGSGAPRSPEKSEADRASGLYTTLPEARVSAFIRGEQSAKTSVVSIETAKMAAGAPGSAAQASLLPEMPLQQVILAESAVV
ncbi:unnamed protein product [Amoebophrya sp. A25]|nr:unnamed protein product [Amoebophrya sp. A25]|eukprot:GSA25T00001184001.1